MTDHLALTLFGSLQFAQDGIALSAFDSDKTRALLAYLSVEAAQPHRRTALIGLFWPESGEAAARRSLSQALLVIRQAIGDYHAQPPFLRITRDTIQFERASNYTLDVAAFESLLAAVEAHRHPVGQLCAACGGRLQQAVELYRGPFLHGFFPRTGEEFEAWAGTRREAYHQQVMRALVQLTAYWTQRGDHDTALHWARRALFCDPAHEESHRQVMRLLAQTGDRSGALAQYEACCAVLAEALGVEPEGETQSLFERIRRGEIGRLSGSAPQFLPPVPLQRLPAPITAMIGRERELAKLTRLICEPTCRLTTIVGPGGIGKTRLAIGAAHAVADNFAQGAAFVELAPVSDPLLVVAAIAAALGMIFTGRADPKTELVEYLRWQELLMVLDNCEHVLAAAGVLVELLQNAPGLKLLATSREVFGISGEWALELRGLPLCQPDGSRAGALALFVERAGQAGSGIPLGADDMAVAAEICRLVGGVPLGIELAAAWRQALSCAEIAAEIRRSMAFLTSSSNGIPERHRSMRAVFEHSWRLLDRHEQQVLGRLSVFRNAFQREAAAEVAGATLADLTSLVRKSLVRRTATGEYDVHELVRAFAYEQLVAAGEQTDMHHRHLRSLLQAVEAAEPQLTGGDQLGAFAALDRLVPSIRAALGWALSVQDDEASELALRLCDGLGTFWGLRGHFAEGRDWLAAALARYPAHSTLDDLTSKRPEATRVRARTALRASALRSLGQLTQHHDPLAARRLLEEGLALQQALGNPAGIVKALQSLGTVVMGQGDPQLARSLLGESLQLAQSLGDASAVAATLRVLGYIAHDLRDEAAAERYFEQSMQLCQSLGDRVGAARALGNLGELARTKGDDERAYALYHACHVTLRELGFTIGVASVTHNMAHLALQKGAIAQARAYFAESLVLYQALGSRIGIAECLAGLGAVALAGGDALRAGRIFGATEHLRAATSMIFSPADQASFAQRVADARAAAGSEAAFAAAWNAGQLLTLDAVVAEALRDSAPAV